MSPRPPVNVPTAFSITRRQLDQWRDAPQGRKRLPQELWSKAVALARKHGLNKTARTLRLKYIECTIELKDDRGAKMRMHVKGASLADLASFARGFLGGRA